MAQTEQALDGVEVRRQVACAEQIGDHRAHRDGRHLAGTDLERAISPLIARDTALQSVILPRR
jgi:hypothetical protein